MSVKALRNQLLAAIAMVLVAALALGSSTFAWFASNNTVTAQNMTVTAQSDAKFLEIHNSDTTTNFVNGTIVADAITANNSATLYPSTPYTPHASENHVTEVLNVDEGNLVWNYTYSNLVNNATKGTGFAWYVVGDTGNHTAAESYLTDTFYFRMNRDGATGSKLKATSASFSGVTDDTISEAICVVLEGANGYQVIKYNDGTPTITNYNKTTGAVETDEAFAGLVSTVTYHADNAVATAESVKVHVYFDGEFSTVYTNNLVNDLEGVLASITFAVA